MRPISALFSVARTLTHRFVRKDHSFARSEGKNMRERTRL